MTKKKKPAAKPPKSQSKPARRLDGDKDTFCHPDTTASQVVLVDAELKGLANAYIDAWHRCNLDHLEQELPDLGARFLRTENAEEALAKVRAFVGYVFKQEAARLGLPQRATDENLPVPARIVLPEIFSWPATDIADSTKDHDVKRGCDVEAAKLYLAVFTGTHFKRLVLTNAHDASQERKQLLADVQAAQECLVAYLTAMLKRVRQHVVQIGQDLGIEIDGQPVAAKGAAKRALLALALMRDKPSFSTTSFSQVYYGPNRTPGDTASEFTTAIRDAKKLVRGLSYESDNKGNRTISGIFFVVEASDEQIKQAIAGLLTAAQ